jgi:hypothetical protein
VAVIFFGDSEIEAMERPRMSVASEVENVDSLLAILKLNLTSKRILDLENGGIINILVASKKWTRTAIANNIGQSVHWVCRRQTYFVVVLHLRKLLKNKILPPCSIVDVVEVASLANLVDIGQQTQFKFESATIKVINFIYFVLLPKSLGMERIARTC